MDPDDTLIAAMRALDLKPRSHRWTSLTYCIVDAVWSIGARYDSVVVPVVRSVATAFADESPLSEPARMPADPVPLKKFVDQYPTTEAFVSAVGNRQRTSTRGGILKAEAVRRYCDVFLTNDIGTLDEATSLLGEPTAVESVDAALRAVPGDGSSGIRRSYLWMLVGDDERIKPDRMVMRWLAARGFRGDPEDAKALIQRAADDISKGRDRVSPWMIDHAIWTAQRASRRAG